MKRKLKVRIIRSKKILWHVQLVAPNNKIRLSSETYYNKSNAIRAGRQLAIDMGVELEINAH